MRRDNNPDGKNTFMTTHTDAQSLQAQLDLAPMDQVGFVVPDIEQAMKDYGPLFGPWQQMEVDLQDADFRGENNHCYIKMAFGKSGDLEIELIEITDGVSPHTEFLEQGRSGMHHIRFPTPDLEGAIAKAQQIGYQPIWQKRFSDVMAFCYLERPGDPLLIEFIQQPGQ